MNTIKISDITLHRDYEFFCSVLYRFNESCYHDKIEILNQTLCYMIKQEDLEVCRVYFIILAYIENL